MSLRVAATALAVVLAARAAMAQGRAEVVLDAVLEFNMAAVAHAADARAGADTIGGLRLPDVFLHPSAMPATLTYRSVELPQVAPGERLLLLARLGIREGVPWDAVEAKPNGVRFSVAINGDTAIVGDVAESRWVPVAADLGRWAGSNVDVVFQTDALGNTAYDWACFGDPLIVLLKPGPGEDRPEGPGVVVCDEPDAELGLATVSGGSGAAGIVASSPGRGTMYVFAGAPLLEWVSASPPIAFPGDTVELRVRVRNTGRGTWTDGAVSLPTAGGLILSGPSRLPVPPIPPGESATVSRPATVARNASGVVKLAAHVGSQRVHGRLLVGERGAGPAIAFGDGSVELVSADGVCVGAIAHVGAGSYARPIGQIVPLVRLATLTAAAAEHVGDEPLALKVAGATPERVRLEAASERFTVAVTMAAGEDGTLSMEHELLASDRLEVLAFGGPTVIAGAAAYGDAKTDGLFPGLEFLEGDEPSSNPRDAHPPLNLKTVPHPFSVTVPMMSVSGAGAYVGLAWDPLQEWAPGERYPSAQFASPDFLHGVRGHRMSLFVPTVPDYVPENSSTAETPFVLERGERISLHSKLMVGKGGSLDALMRWIAIRGLPWQDLPRTEAEQIAICRAGLLDTVWDEETPGWRHCVGWAPAPSPGLAVLALRDAYENPASGQAAELERRARKVVDAIVDRDPAGLASRAVCHIMKWEAPFWVGHVGAALEAVRHEAEGLIASQSPDGYWVFRPGPTNAALGVAGDHVLGTTAGHAAALLKYARIANDAEALAAGERALAAMMQYRVPRGAQVWECPMYEPDILAAAHAVAAYTEGYRITGKQDYLDAAEYWATTGLPFLYLWEAPDRPGMAYAGIPVFGTTFFVHTWIGRPVQWCALVYGHALSQLADQLPTSSAKLWRRVAWGITASAGHQQFAEGELMGTYPDGWYDHFTARNGPFINPEDILVGLYDSTGREVDVSTVVLTTPSRRIHITSAAVVSLARLTPQGLRFRLDFFEGRPAFALVAGAGEPMAVRVNGRDLPRASGSLAGPGYRHVQGRDWTEIGVEFPPDSQTANVQVVLTR